MITISVNYTCKYRLNFAKHYVFTKCKKCYNLKSERLIKQVYKGGSIGYIINGKFHTLTRLKNHLEKIPSNFKY